MNDHKWECPSVGVRQKPEGAAQRGKNGTYGYESKPWYPSEPQITGKWMFIPPNIARLVLIHPHMDVWANLLCRVLCVADPVGYFRDDCLQLIDYFIALK